MKNIAQKLAENIVEQVLEMQLKLGFADESVSLYFPYASVGSLLKEKTENLTQNKEDKASALEQGEKIPQKEASAQGEASIQINSLDKNAITERLKRALAEPELLKLGKITATPLKDRVVLVLSAETVKYIHDNFQPSEFLKSLVELFSARHGITMENVLELFNRFSSDYVCEKMPEGSDFDFAIHFSDTDIDGFYYCIKDEFGHMTYHRFTESDYLALTEA